MARATTVAVASALLIALVTAHPGAQRLQRDGSRRSFRAMNGASVAQFRIPSDMRAVASERVGPARSIAAERYQQFLGDAEVLGAQITVYRDDAGVKDAVIGAHYSNVVPRNRVRLSAAGAQSIAAARRAARDASWQVDLMIDPGRSRYFYQVESRGFSARWFYWIDAESGELLNEYDGLTTGSGVGVHGDWKDLTGLTTKAKGSFRLVPPGNRLKTNDARSGVALPGSMATDANDVWDSLGRLSPGQGALVDAHFYSNATDRYYRTERGFDWLAHYPQGMVSSAHVGVDYANAFWNGTQTAYGDGDGVTFLEFSGGLDIVAHEVSHGVTEATSRLVYQNQSGALSEAFSDIMGSVIEFHYEGAAADWTIGEDVTRWATGLRNMANPIEYGQPSHYDDMLFGEADNGFVHYNSGIVNHWFYLLSVGGRNANLSHVSGTSVSGIGIEAAADIAYFGLTALPANASFCDARASTIAVAGAQKANVETAWTEVGLTPSRCADSDGVDATPPQISAVAARMLSSTTFEISWQTDEPSDSKVIFTNRTTTVDPRPVENHVMVFDGKKNLTYTYTVESRDDWGNVATLGPFSIRLR